MAPDRREIDGIAERNHFVLTREELLAAGVSDGWMRRQVDNRLWQRPYSGVYITASGESSWLTRVRAALAYAGQGAALSHSTAAEWWLESENYRRRRPSGLIEISVPGKRTVNPQRGLRIHRRKVMPAVLRGSIALTTREETVVDLVRQASNDDDVVGILTRAVRKVEPLKILLALHGRARMRHRSLVVDVLTEVATGIESPLELRYRRDVERAHGLPVSELQIREVLSGRWVRADSRYRAYRTRVELDGQLAHPGGRTDDDTWRDNAALLETDEITLRYRWRHVAGMACRTAEQVAAALRKGGWRGTPRPCGPTCPLADFH